VGGEPAILLSVDASWVPLRRHAFIHLRDVYIFPWHIPIAERTQHDPWCTSAAHRRDKPAAGIDCRAGFGSYRHRHRAGRRLVIRKDFDFHFGFQRPITQAALPGPSVVTRSTSRHLGLAVRLFQVSSELISHRGQEFVAEVAFTA
jgi:hypothetical protein